MSHNIFKEILKALIAEELGQARPRANRGYGAVHPYYVKSYREMLGDVEKDIKKQKKNKNPVKISRVFTNRKSDD